MLTAVLLAAGCTSDIMGSSDLTWHRFARYQRVQRPCSVVFADYVSSYVTVATADVWTYRLHFGESLRANAPRALSKLFDEVHVVTQAEGEKLLATTPLLSITEIHVAVRPPVSSYTDASAELILSGEIQTSETDQPLTWRVRGNARALSNSAWPDEVLDGSVEEALNELTRFLSTSPLGASPE